MALSTGDFPAGHQAGNSNENSRDHFLGLRLGPGSGDLGCSGHLAGMADGPDLVASIRNRLDAELQNIGRRKIVCGRAAGDPDLACRKAGDLAGTDSPGVRQRNSCSPGAVAAAQRTNDFRPVPTLAADFARGDARPVSAWADTDAS